MCIEMSCGSYILCDVIAERLQTFLTGHRGVRRSFELRKTSLAFVQPGAKLDSSYYCEVVLNLGLLPDIQKLSANNFTFQQDGAPAHR